MATEVDIDLYADDIEQDFNADEFAAEGVDLYDDVITTTSGRRDSEGGDPQSQSADDPSTPNIVTSPVSSKSNSAGSNHDHMRDREYIQPLRKHQGNYYFIDINVLWAHDKKWTSDRDIQESLNDIGVHDFVEVKFYENRANGQSKGYCVLTVGSEASLKLIKDKLGKKEIHGQTPMVTPPTKQALNQFEAQSKTRPNPGPGSGGSGGGGGGGGGGNMMGGPYGQSRPMGPMGLSHPNQMGMGGYRMGMGSPGIRGGHPGRGGMGPGGGPGLGPPPGHRNIGPPNHHQGSPGGGQFSPPQRPPMGHNLPPPGPHNMMDMKQRPGPPPGMPMPPFQGQGPPQGPMGPRGPMPPHNHNMVMDMKQRPGPPPDWSRPPMNSYPPSHGQPNLPPPGPIPGPPPVRGGMITGPPQGPAPHMNPAFFNPPGPTGPPQGPPPTYNNSPRTQSAQYPPAPSEHHEVPPPLNTMSEAEFEEVMGRNRTVSRSAISRAVTDAASGEFASAIETLVTAISLIKQSKVAPDDRCKILISSLQDTLHGIEAKSYARREQRSRSRSRERDRHRRSRRERSRERDYRERRDSRERYYDYPRERSRSRDRGEYRERTREESGRYYEDRYRERDRERERERPRVEPDRSREREREREPEREAVHRPPRH